MTDKAIEAALEAHANSPTIVDFETAYNAMRAAIAAYENVRCDEAIGRYREVLDRQRNRPFPPPPGKDEISKQEKL